MRIRKNVKVAPLMYAMSSLKADIILQPHVCQLNQSQWDTINFSPLPSPPLTQINESSTSPENEYGVAAKRELNVDAMQEVKEDHHLRLSPVEVVNCKTDGKSTQCRCEASQCHRLCEDHLSLVDGYHNNSKKSAAAGETHSSCNLRPRKAPVRYFFEEEEDVGKKRARKKIKVKSLKSLM